MGTEICKHGKITTYHLIDSSEPAGLWGCATCGRKFVPLDLGPVCDTRSEKLADAGFARRPSLRAIEMRQALELIAAPMRSDGTWNRDRAACCLLAAEALGRYDDDQMTSNGRSERPPA